MKQKKAPSPKGQNPWWGDKEPRYITRIKQKSAYPLRRFGLYRERFMEGCEEPVFRRDRMSTRAKTRVMWVNTWQGFRQACINSEQISQVDINKES